MSKRGRGRRLIESRRSSSGELFLIRCSIDALACLSCKIVEQIKSHAAIIFYQQTKESKQCSFS